MSTPIEILYEDGPVLVVNKPAGLLTQAPLGIDNLEVRVKQFLKQREGKEGNIYLAVLHRIDRPVSGAIAFARHVRAARRISEQFEGRMVEKKYWALVASGLDRQSDTWTDYLLKVDGEAKSIVVDAADPLGKLAVLHYQLREIGLSAHYRWLEIELETGRTHQIRIQCASRGFPLLGDELYGSEQAFGPAAADARERTIALHARTLKFRHPLTNEPVEITAPLPSYWPQAIRDIADASQTNA